MDIAERSQPIEETNVHWREAGPAAGAPTLYVHGVPTDGDDWLSFLERTGGYAPDLPGFGRSDKPAHFDYSIDGYARFLRAFVDELALARLSLVVHDWGAVALALAGQIPERIERLVVIDAVPLIEGYRWHPTARVWRVPLAGEFAMGLTFKWTLDRRSRQFLAADGPARVELVERIWRHFDHGTQRAILKLYRSAPPPELAAAGARLAAITAPALVVWGADDPYVPASFADAYAARLGGPASVEVASGARHWPWLDDPSLVDRICDFLTSG